MRACERERKKERGRDLERGKENEDDRDEEKHVEQRDMFAYVRVRNTCDACECNACIRMLR